MAEKGIFAAPYLLFNAVDLTSRLRSLNPNFDIEGQDDTVSGDLGKSEASGLDVHTVEATFNQDFAASGAGSVDATISERIGIGKTATLEIRPDSGAVSATNPKWSGTVRVANYVPFAGEVGGQTIATVRFFGRLVRATA